MKGHTVTLTGGPRDQQTIAIFEGVSSLHWPDATYRRNRQKRGDFLFSGVHEPSDGGYCPSARGHDWADWGWFRIMSMPIARLTSPNDAPPPVRDDPPLNAWRARKCRNCGAHQAEHKDGAPIAFIP